MIDIGLSILLGFYLITGGMVVGGCLSEYSNKNGKRTKIFYRGKYRWLTF